MGSEQDLKFGIQLTNEIFKEKVIQRRLLLIRVVSQEVSYWEFTLQLRTWIIY